MNKIYTIENYNEITDVKQIVDLIQEQFNTYGVKKSYEEINDSLKNALSTKSRSVLFLLSYEDTILGFSFGNVGSGLESGGDYLWLNELYIRRQSRGNGFGKSLIRYIENWCKENLIVYLSCSTGIKNDSAQKFYKKLSFDLSETIWVDKEL